MSDLVTPPWDLCGFDRDYDPYSIPASAVYRFLFLPRAIGIPPVIERVQPDPNGRDGEWRELAFMPHRETWPVVEAWKGAEHLERAGVRSDRPVPEYLTLRDALVRERVYRVAARVDVPRSRPVR